MVLPFKNCRPPRRLSFKAWLGAGPPWHPASATLALGLPRHTSLQSPLVKINAMAGKQLGLASQGSTVSQQQHVHPLNCRLLRRCYSQTSKPGRPSLKLQSSLPPPGASVISPPELETYPTSPRGGTEKSIQVMNPDQVGTYFLAANS